MVIANGIRGFIEMLLSRFHDDISFLTAQGPGAIKERHDKYCMVLKVTNDLR